MLTRLLPLLVTCLFLAACDSQTTKQQDDQKAAADAKDAGPSGAEDGNTAPDPLADAETFERDGITAKSASWDQVQKYVAAQQGKVVVVDAWSNWCDPCIKEFPNLVALQKKYPEKIVCVSFNVEYDGAEDTSPKANSEAILDFLVEQKADIQNLISSTPHNEWYKTIDLAGIPVVFVYGPDGKLAKRFDNDTLAYGTEGFTYEDHIIPLIETLVK
jgi:thiol-disulfide isomerase/thioredoxin